MAWPASPKPMKETRGVLRRVMARSLTCEHSKSFSYQQSSQHIQRLRILRRRKSAIERGDIIRRQFEVERSEIFLDMRPRASLRNRDHVFLPEQPGERDLCRR